jgi:GntR family transcriptional repressor for pyruvate dehydrogenase complex
MSSPVHHVLASVSTDPLSRNGKLSEAVAKRIVDDIAEQHLEPGAKLPSERVMLERFGVSRGTLREALRILEVHGLLVIRSGPRGGPIVAEMTASDFSKACSLHFNAAGMTVSELWRARSELEPMLARLAATNESAEVRDRLDELVEAAREAHIEDSGTYIRVSAAFHTVIADCSGNPVLSLFVRSLAEMATQVESGAVFPGEEHGRVTQDHIAIAEAIRAADAAEAQRLMAIHMNEIVSTHTRRYPGLLNNVLPYVI